jgi:hypothetical protein
VTLPRPLIVAALVACAVVPAGCGGDDDSGGGSTQSEPSPAHAADFPKANGKSLAEIRSALPKTGPILSPSVSDLVPGKNRFGFALFRPDRSQIANASVALYVAPSGGGPATGPYLARYESLAVKPQFQSKTVQQDPDAANSIYVTDVDLPNAGKYDVLGVANINGKLVAATPVGPPATAVKDDPVPNVGDPAPRIQTLTTTDVGGDVSKIDTRVPPSDMHKVDFADVVGKKPVVLVFATPQLCQSRVCGPVVDLAYQAESDHSDDADFIHQEIYNDNSIDKGFRPQVAAFHLPTEPWLFVIDRNGKVAARIEGAFSYRELEAAIDKGTG